MMSSPTFNHNWRVSIFCLVCLVAFIKLGFWQLDRQEEKRVLMADREARQQGPSLTASEVGTEGSDLGGLPVLLSGFFHDDATLLLDNVVLDGSVGIEVHQLFADFSGRYFLINRGFVPMGRTRGDPLDIPPTRSQQVQIVGTVYQRGGAPLRLRQSESPEWTFPAIVQYVDVSQLARQINKEVYPYVIRLNEGQHGALPRFWPDTVIPPEKHPGYAIQWFTMAATVIILWLFFCFRKEQEL